MISAQITHRVRYAETDRMGMAYHGNYLAWFEMARVQMLDNIGIPYRGLEDEGYRLPVLEAWVCYRRPVTFDDRLTITACLREAAGLRLRIEYQVRMDDLLIAEGFTRHAFINEEGKPVRPPARFVAILKQTPDDPPRHGAPLSGPDRSIPSG